MSWRVPGPWGVRVALLDLTHVKARLWEAFQRGDGPPSPHPVASRWARSLSLGVGPEGRPEGKELLRGAALKARQGESEALLLAAEGALEDRIPFFEAADFSLLVTDAQGVILKASAGGAFRETARRLNLLEGGRWAEEVQGTNAIGTALAEGCAVSVLGSAHFIRTNHALVCYASPIHDPYGRLLGVLDVTSDARAADARVQRAVNEGARAISDALRRRAWRSAGYGVVRLLLDRSPGPALLIEWPGVIRGANASALKALGEDRGAHRGGDVGGDLKELCGLSWGHLLAQAEAGAGTIALPRWGSDPRPRRATLHPAFGPTGLVLGVILLLEEAPARAPTPRRAPATTPTATPAPDPFGALLGDDPTLLKTKALAARVAPSELPVLLLAETGTGKGLLAQAIHDASRRRTGPLVHVNCGALSPQLLESTLFGYAPGAFTGAKREGQEGMIHRASGGTLFLDEIGEMSGPLQAMLLKVLEEGTYFRVGESIPRRGDLRLICATCQDLPGLIQAGRFRQDLYYRIRGLSLSLPPLRARADLLTLADALLARFAEDGTRPGGARLHLSPEAARALEAHPWPGNVRELRMSLQLAVTLAEGDAITLEDLPPELQCQSLVTQRHLPHPGSPPDAPTLRETQRDRLIAALHAEGGNVSAAARRLGVARSTVYRMMERFGISPQLMGGAPSA